MRILSIDVGIKNLSYCCIELSESFKILDWNNVCVIDGNCKRMLLEAMVEAVLECLMKNFDEMFEADIVIIENQPKKNGMMKTIAVVLYTYFNMLKLQYGNIQQVRFMFARNKLKLNKNSTLTEDSYEQCKTYSGRKKHCIHLVRLYLEDLCPSKLEWFESIKKKDDYSDSFAQALYYIETVLKRDLCTG